MNPDLYAWEMHDHGQFCRCRCHRYVVIDDATGALISAGGATPRFDQSLAWAESCDMCSGLHWIAASVHDHVRSLGADAEEAAASYLAHFISKQRKI